MNEISRKPAHTVAELASARQHQENPADHHGARGARMDLPKKMLWLLAIFFKKKRKKRSCKHIKHIVKYMEV